jgi:hypothetical protein
LLRSHYFLTIKLNQMHKPLFLVPAIAALLLAACTKETTLPPGAAARADTNAGVIIDPNGGPQDQPADPKPPASHGEFPWQVSRAANSSPKPGGNGSGLDPSGKPIVQHNAAVPGIVGGSPAQPGQFPYQTKE